MHYFVRGADGQRYGPVDLATLNQWAVEGRVQPQTEIVDVATGGSVLASQMPGLHLPASPYAQPPSPYPRGYEYSTQPPGSTELTLSWVFGALTVVACCTVLPGVGWYFANKAAALGHPNTAGARAFNIVMLVLSLFFVVFYLVLGTGMVFAGI